MCSRSHVVRRAGGLQVIENLPVAAAYCRLARRTSNHSRRAVTRTELAEALVTLLQGEMLDDVKARDHLEGPIGERQSRDVAQDGDGARSIGPAAPP